MSIHPPQLLDLRGRLPVHAFKRWRTRTVEEIRCIVTHQSLGSAEPLEPGLLTRHMAAYHVRRDERGIAYGRDWPGLAYHFSIEPAGQIVWANDLESATYHSGGRRNWDGLGIVVCGDFAGPGHPGRDVPTAEQQAAWLRLMQWLRSDFDVPAERVYGHCDAPGSTRKPACPGDAIMGWIEQLRGMVYDKI